MPKWFECKIKYTKIDEKGKEKKVTETYLMDALSYTEAETRTNEELGSFITGEFMITGIKTSNLSEIYPNEEGDRWFKCKLTMITFDEESGKESKSNSYILVQSNNVHEAYEAMQQFMKGSVADYEIPAITESPILDVFPYFNGDGETSMAPANDFSMPAEGISETHVEEEETETAIDEVEEDWSEDEEDTDSYEVPEVESDDFEEEFSEEEEEEQI